VELPAEPADRLAGVQQGAGSRGAQGHDHLRADDLQLPHQVGAARGDLVAGRVAVVRRAALQHVADEDLVAGQGHGLDHAGEQLTGRSDEGQALTVFFEPGGFADKDQPGGRAALAEDGPRARFGQAALPAAADFLLVDHLKAGGAVSHGGCVNGNTRRRGRTGCLGWVALVGRRGGGNTCAGSLRAMGCRRFPAANGAELGCGNRHRAQAECLLRGQVLTDNATDAVRVNHDAAPLPVPPRL